MIRLPAEWEPQDGVLLAWPHKESDWLPYLSVVEPVYCDIARHISRFEKVIIVTHETKRVTSMLEEAGASMANVIFAAIPTNDTWARDFGPLTIEENDRPVMLDFGFNGWGLKFAANEDNQVNRRLHARRMFADIPLRVPGLILEGGSIESDGKGTILTTSECLLNCNRNPHLDRCDLEEKLGIHLGAERILWLDHGYLAGDDTDSHIDTLARLCPDDTILYVSCSDHSDEHFDELKAMEQQLGTFLTKEGNPYRLIPLPWPALREDEDGLRLPATYANYLIINGAVLVPTYRDKADADALEAVAAAFPGREIIGIDCLPLILQHGSLHCVTMQLPKGTLS